MQYSATGAAGDVFDLSFAFFRGNDKIDPSRSFDGPEQLLADLAGPIDRRVDCTWPWTELRLTPGAFAPCPRITLPTAFPRSVADVMALADAPESIELRRRLLAGDVAGLPCADCVWHRRRGHREGGRRPVRKWLLTLPDRLMLSATPDVGFPDGAAELVALLDVALDACRVAFTGPLAAGGAAVLDAACGRGAAAAALELEVGVEDLAALDDRVSALRRLRVVLDGIGAAFGWLRASLPWSAVEAVLRDVAARLPGGPGALVLCIPVTAAVLEDLGEAVAFAGRLGVDIDLLPVEYHPLVGLATPAERERALEADGFRDIDPPRLPAIEARCRSAAAAAAAAGMESACSSIACLPGYAAARAGRDRHLRAMSEAGRKLAQAGYLETARTAAAQLRANPRYRRKGMSLEAEIEKLSGIDGFRPGQAEHLS